MITFNDLGYMGRLGNQMFQYAALLGIADKTGFDIGIPLNNLNTKPDGCLDKFTRKWIPYKLDLVDGFNIPFVDSSEHTFLNHKEEVGHHFDPNFFSIPDGTNIKGYFQTEKYFEHIKDTVKDVFTFHPYIQSLANTLLSKIPGPKVSLHFRRGDYLGDQHLFPILGLDYYQEAINTFTDQNYSFVIFSDDINWCKKALGQNERLFYIEGNSQYVDLCAMSMCNHNIIANSTFSWWGAWLNSNPTKRIIAPNTWFGPGLAHLNDQDVIPSNWIKIC